jgi:hypothetical protein
MKKLFLPLALLTISAAYAMDEAQAPTEEQIAAQQQMLQNAGEQLASNLLNQDPALSEWYNDASDEDSAAFDALCIQYATLNIIVYGQFAPNYNQLFNALSDLTGRSNWSVQINFMSNDLAQALQAQAQAQDTAVSEDDEN